MSNVRIPEVGPLIPVGEFLLIEARFPAVYLLFHRGEVVYVGQSKTLRWRIETHINEGKKVFDAIAFAKCSVNHLTKVERFYIAEYAPKYNACAVAVGTRDRESWRVERERAALKRNRGRFDCPDDANTDEGINADECFLDVPGMGEFMQVGNSDVDRWISEGKLVGNSVVDLIYFVAANTREVTKAQERFAAL